MDPKIIGEKIKQAYPQYANIDAATIGNKYLQKYGGAVNAVQSGQMKITDLPVEQRVGASLGVTQQGSTAEEKQVNEVKDTIGGIDTILGKDLGMVTGKSSVFGLIPGTESYGIRKQIQQIKDQLSLASVGKLKGQGQVSDAERKMLASSSTALNVGMREEDFRKELKKVKNILSRNIGVEETAVSEPQKTGLSKIPVIGGILEQLKGYSQDVGVGLALKGKAGQEAAASQQQSMEMANKLEQQALSAKTPEEKQRLLSVAQQARGQVSQATQGIEAGFSKDIAKDYGGRGFETATNIAMLAEIPALIKAMPTLGKKLALIKSPSKAIGVIRDTAVKEAEKKGVSFSGASIKKAGEEYIKQDPLATKLWEKILPSIGKKMSPSQLMKKIDVWNKAYTAASKVGKSSKAGLYDVLARSAKGQVVDKAPDVAKATRLFSMFYRGKKTLGRVTSPVIGAVGAGAGGALLYRLLGKGQ